MFHGGGNTCATYYSYISVNFNVNVKSKSEFHIFRFHLEIFISKLSKMTKLYLFLIYLFSNEEWFGLFSKYKVHFFRNFSLFNIRKGISNKILVLKGIRRWPIFLKFWFEGAEMGFAHQKWNFFCFTCFAPPYMIGLDKTAYYLQYKWEVMVFIAPPTPTRVWFATSTCRVQNPNLTQTQCNSSWG